MTRAGIALAFAVLLLALPGCREDEQGRPLGLAKGVYQGKAGTPLDPRTIDALERRAQNEKG